MNDEGVCRHQWPPRFGRIVVHVIQRAIGIDDLVQEVVISGIRQLDRFAFRHEQVFLAYLRTSIRYRIIDELRPTQRRPMLVPLAGHPGADALFAPALLPLQSDFHPCLVRGRDEYPRNRLIARLDDK